MTYNTLLYTITYLSASGLMADIFCTLNEAGKTKQIQVFPLISNFVNIETLQTYRKIPETTLNEYDQK